MKLIDQIFADSHITPETKAVLKSSVLIDATHVGEYFWGLSNEKEWIVKKNIPNIAPPFETFFLEFQTPLSLVLKYHFPSQWGFLCWGKEREIPDHAKWTLLLTFFQKLPGAQSLGPHWTFLLEVTEDGHFIDREDGGTDLYDVPEGETKQMLEKMHRLNPNQADDLYASTKREITRLLLPTLLAVAFMHCKNVVLHKQAPPTVKPTPKQKRQRIQPYQPVTYHVLDIEPMKQVLKTEGKSDQVGLQRALHICRGHFSTYTEDHKLFGKYAGTFWIPQHVRGSAENGFATKDYCIKLDK